MSVRVRVPPMATLRRVWSSSTRTDSDCEQAFVTCKGDRVWFRVSPLGVVGRVPESVRR